MRDNTLFLRSKIECHSDERMVCFALEILVTRFDIVHIMRACLLPSLVRDEYMRHSLFIGFDGRVVDINRDHLVNIRLVVAALNCTGTNPVPEGPLTAAAKEQIRAGVVYRMSTYSQDTGAAIFLSIVIQ